MREFYPLKFFFLPVEVLNMYVCMYAYVPIIYTYVIVESITLRKTRPKVS